MDEAKAWVIKVILFSSFAGVAVKLAMMAAYRKLTWLNATTSIITGLFTAALLGPIIIKNVSIEYAAVLIAVTAMLSEKICGWLLFKFNIDTVMTTFIETLIDKFKKK